MSLPESMEIIDVTETQVINNPIGVKSEFFSSNECRFFVAVLEDDVDDDANEISFNELLLGKFFLILESNFEGLNPKADFLYFLAIFWPNALLYFLAIFCYVFLPVFLQNFLLYFLASFWAKFLVIFSCQFVAKFLGCLLFLNLEIPIFSRGVGTYLQVGGQGPKWGGKKKKF